jgi:hypothetical protein
MNISVFNKIKQAFKIKNSDDCLIYRKHHNIIDSIWSVLKPSTWEEIPEIEKYDKDDEDGTLLKMLKDLYIYDINEMNDFKLPTDEHNIEETIFIIRNGDNYYLCESQGEDYVKFSIKINSIDYIKRYDRKVKLEEILKKFKK